MTKIIGISDVAVIVRAVGVTGLLDELIDRLRSSLASFDAELLETHDRTGFHYDKPGLGLVEWMPAMDVGRRVSVKTVGYHPANPAQRNSPSVLATTSLYDTTDGRLLLVCEATVLTALRTGAASAIATDVLAAPEASVLGVVGCGAQAVTQIHALSRVRPIERVVAFDTSAAVAESLPSRLDRLELDPVDVQLVGPDDLGRLMSEADVLCTATTVDPGAGPVVPESEHRPWLHINAVGADFPGKREIPLTYLDDALVCPDVPAQCLVEGEAQQLRAEDLGPDLAVLVRNEGEYRRYRELLTVFDSTGWALEDLVAAELLSDHADRLGVGTEVDLQPTTDDPYDPYRALDGVEVGPRKRDPR
ncbi:MAG: ornithine cyclodeaminase family protein [Acidimicrobiia bacterium]|nr:ornithine cyclodeaminase family protein [Acidimicrobiia bacterium]